MDASEVVFVGYYLIEYGMPSLAIGEHFDGLEHSVREFSIFPLFFPSSNSICMDDQRESIMVLSRPSPTVPNDGRGSAERIF